MSVLFYSQSLHAVIGRIGFHNPNNTPLQFQAKPKTQNLETSPRRFAVASPRGQGKSCTARGVRVRRKMTIIPKQSLFYFGIVQQSRLPFSSCSGSTRICSKPRPSRGRNDVGSMFSAGCRGIGCEVASWAAHCHRLLGRGGALSGQCFRSES